MNNHYSKTKEGRAKFEYKIASNRVEKLERLLEEAQLEMRNRRIELEILLESTEA